MNVLIFGLGLHGGGVGVANYFINRGDNVVVTDLKSESELKKSIGRLKKSKNLKLSLGGHSYNDIKWADLIIKNPGVPPDSPYIVEAQKLGKKIESDIGIFLDIVLQKTENIIGVTGTRGKSTTTYLIYEMMKRNFSNVFIAGNITISVFDILDRITDKSWLALELSSFQLGGIKNKKFSPRFSVLTNILNDHLNYYGSMDSYFEDKSVIFKYQKPGDFLIVNRENEIFELIKPNSGVNLYSFGFKKFTGNGIYIDGRKAIFRDGESVRELFNIDIIKLRGVHNLKNVMAAALVAIKAGVEVKHIVDVVSTFNGLEHRMEYIGKLNGIDIYNDSASTTPDAVRAALDVLEGRNILLVTGGTDKGLPLEKFVKILNNNKDIKKILFLDGSGTERLLSYGINKDYRVYGNLENAVNDAIKKGSDVEVILFSPGFASFELFENEFDRGNKFKKIVYSYIKGTKEFQEKD